MMGTIAQWLDARRHRRIIVMAVLFPLPIFVVVSGAIVVMTSARRGWREAGVDCALALVVLGLISVVSGGAWQSVVWPATTMWAFLTAIGGLAGAVPALNLPFQIMVFGVAAVATLFTIVTGDPTEYWRPAVEGFAEAIGDMGLEAPPAAALENLAGVFTGLVGASFIVSLALTTFLGIAWVCQLNDRPFGDLFRDLRLGYVIGVLAALAGLIALIPGMRIAENLTLIFAAAFLFQGLAVLHWFARVRGWPKFWPVGVYLPLFLGPAIAFGVAFALSTTGFVDNWFNLRRQRSNVV